MTRRIKTVDRARGRWREILPRLGVETRYLTNRQGPCPLCGGKTRFRFDDKEGRGTWYCNHDGAGNGLQLVQRVNGWDFRTAVGEIDKIVGISDPPNAGKPPLNDWKRRYRDIQAAITGATDRAIVTAYLTRRGLSVTSPVLLGHPACPYYDTANKFIGRFPAVIAPIHNNAGVLQSVQRIYDAGPEPRKKTMRPVETISGCAVRLCEPTDELGIAEGCETALAAHQLFGVPVWSVLCAYGIESFEPPPAIRRLTIFGDNDHSFVDQAAAFKLAAHLRGASLSVDVRIPEQPGTDWLDVLTGRHP